MFQIKFLKPLTLSKNKKVCTSHRYKPKPNDPVYELSSTLTVANDLGEQFFYGDALLNIAVKVQETPDIKAVKRAKLLSRSQITWTAGRRALDFQILMKLSDVVAGDYVSVQISFDESQPVKDQLNFEKTTTKELKKAIIDESMTLFSDSRGSYEYNLNDTKFYDTISDLIQIPQTLDSLPIKTERISKRLISDTILFEELSGSIARHLWDAGILVSELSKKKLLDFLDYDDETVSKKLNILELGTGIGLVSIQISKIFPNAEILATDLEDSQEVCVKNINFNNVSEKVTFSELDWESETKTNKTWDLIIITDCTYNPLYYDALIKILKRETKNLHTKVLLSHKFREPISECEIFRKLEKANFQLCKNIWHNIGGQNLVHTGFYSV